MRLLEDFMGTTVPEAAAYLVRPTMPADTTKIADLYRRTAERGSGLARNCLEMDEAYFADIVAEVRRHGVQWVAEATNGAIVGELHAYKIGPRVFDHVMSNLTLCTDPDWRRCGIATRLFEALFHHLEQNEQHISRVELFVRESNRGAVRLYKRLGFQIEGILWGRISNPDGRLENDLVMGRQMGC